MKFHDRWVYIRKYAKAIKWKLYIFTFINIHLIFIYVCKNKIYKTNKKKSIAGREGIGNKGREDTVIIASRIWTECNVHMYRNFTVKSTSLCANFKKCMFPVRMKGT